MGIVERSIGGAGTGKTRQIEQKLTQARDELGLSTQEVGLCTFTRAGRQELSERIAESWGVEVESLTKHGWFRTAHSIAYRQVGVEKGALLEGSEGGEWVSGVLGGPVRAKRNSDTGEVSYESDDGDPVTSCALAAWELARQRLVPVSTVIRERAKLGEESITVTAAKGVIEKYETAKTREGRVDFTDIVAQYAGVRFTIEGPEWCEPRGGVPTDLKVLAVDEAQDSSALVDRICRRLAESPNMERVFLCGDPYQSCFSFTGSDYRLFLSWDAIESTMPQSYRCPPPVMALGEKCLRKMKYGYRERGIRPAPHHGEVRRIGDVGEAIRRLDVSRPALILGRCAFVLAEYEEALRDRGVPFCWIDRVAPAESLSGYRCLWDLEQGEVVSGDDWRNAVAMLSVESKALGKLLVRGEKAAWKEGRRANVDYFRPVPEDFLLAGATEQLGKLILLGEWTKCLEARHQKKAEAWRSSALAFGPDLASNPMVRLSTIHSAKGCEGDTVILSTQSSPAVENARHNSQHAWDEECRVNYVAVTRARENLWIVDDANEYSLEIHA